MAPTGLILAMLGAALAIGGWLWRNKPDPPPLARGLSTWALAFTLVLAGLGLEFAAQGIPDHAAMAHAAAMALLLGHGAGLLLLSLSRGRPFASNLGLALTLGLPPFGAFPGLWLGLQAIQAALMLLPSLTALAFAAAALTALTSWVYAWQDGSRPLNTPSSSKRGRWAPIPVMVLAVLAGFLPWIWVLPAQVVAAWLTHELPLLLSALGMMLTPVIPGQASVIPFGLLAVAMALSSIILLVLRLGSRPR